jgi:sialidase-1
MKESIRVLERITIYENPLPNLVSRHAYFPGLAKLPLGDIIALFPIGEAIDAMNNTVFISRSKDNGKTWHLEGPLHSKDFRPTACSLKPTILGEGELIATGYGFYRYDPEVLVNPKTGGLPEGANLVSFSKDGGIYWSLPEKVLLSRPEVLEVSGPCVKLKNGELIATGAVFPRWDGTCSSGRAGVVLKSRDNGKTWGDRVLFYKSAGGSISPYETRSCQMPDGRVVTMMWLLDEVSGRSLTNHVVVSYDNGETWSQPIDTGVPGQASSLLSLRDNLLLSIHCYREGAVGLYVNIVDFTGDRWKVLAADRIWGGLPSGGIGGLADMGKNLRFGQPSLLQTGKEEFLAVHWAVEDCLGKIIAHRIAVN